MYLSCLIKLGSPSCLKCKILSKYEVHQYITCTIKSKLHSYAYMSYSWRCNSHHTLCLTFLSHITLETIYYTYLITFRNLCTVYCLPIMGNSGSYFPVLAIFSCTLHDRKRIQLSHHQEVKSIKTLKYTRGKYNQWSYQ